MAKRSALVKSLMVASVALLIDISAHLFLSSPFETAFYFLAKFMVFTAVAFAFLSYFSPTTRNGWLASASAAGLFSLYYRLLPVLEGAYNSDLGIPFTELTVLGSGNNAFVGAFFFAVHAIGFYAGLKIVERI